MAETDNVIAKGSQDLKTIEDFVNLPAGSDVYPRLLPDINVGTLSGVRDAIFEAGGLPAKPFATLAKMQTDGASLADGQLAQVYNEAANNGLYVKEAGGWVKALYDPLMQSIANSNALFKPRALTAGENLDELSNGYYYIPNTVIANSLLNLPATMTEPKLCYIFVFKQDGIAYQHLVNYRIEAVEEFKRVGNGAMPDFAYREWQKELELSDIQSLIAASAVVNEGFLSTLTDTAINIDLTLKTLVINDATVRVNTSKESYLLSGHSINLPTVAGAYRIEYVRSTGLLAINTMPTVNTGNIVVAWLYRKNDSDYTITGVNYAVNNVPVTNAGSGGLSVSSSGLLVSVTPTGVNFDYTASQLVITGGTVRVIYGKTTVLLSAQTLALPVNGSHLIVLNKTSGLLSFVAAATPITDDQIIVGGFAPSFKLVFGIDNHSVNGVSSTKKMFTGELIGDPSAVNFDFAVTGKLLITGFKTRVLEGDNTYLLPAKELLLPASNDAYWYRITYVTATGLLAMKQTSVALTGDEIVLGYVQGSSRTVIGFDTYYLNGAPVKQGQSDLATSELIVVNGVTDANYKQTTDLSEFNTFLSTATHAEVYAKYDALVTAYPNYVSRSLLGNDAQGVPIYRYDFKAPDVLAPTQSGYLAKMILVSAVHGFEKAGVMNLFNTLKNICDNWESSEYLETLRWNCHFIVVPIVVPYGFNNMIRHNSNGIDIARNFPAEWEQGVVGSPTYGGTAPLTEIESQLLNNLMIANKDAIYFMSHHNFGGAPDPAQFIWNASATKFGVRLGKMLIARISRNLKSRYAWVSSYPDGYIGLSNINSPKGSESKQATAHGIQGSTFEIGDNLVYAPDSSINSGIVATLGVEVLTNWLLLNLEYGSDLYNSKVRL